LANLARAHLGVALLLTIPLLASCGDDDEGEADTGGSADTGTADTGMTDTGTADTAMADTGMTDVDGDGTACETDCPPSPAPSGSGLVIASVRFEGSDEVVITNLSGGDLDLDGWFVCIRPNYHPLPAMTLADGASLTLVLRDGGTNDAETIYLENPSLSIGSEGEFAVYSSGNFASSSDIEAYVRWGAAASGSNRESVAVGGGLWTAGDFVAVCDDDAGVLAVGDVTTSAGWEGVAAACL
jgi:hypothetical protein